MDNIEYYLNRGNAHNCPPIPTRYTNYLDKNKCLSEFVTSLDKEIARFNLGIPDIIDELNRKIDTKVIERGNIAWDITPTEGNVDKVLSSHVLYNTFLKYALKTDLDNSIQQIWTSIIQKISELHNDIDSELNQLNISFEEKTDEIKCEFRNYTTYINQLFNSLKEEVNDKFNRLDIQQLLIFRESLLEEFEQFKNEINSSISDIQREMSEYKQELNNKFETLETHIEETIQNKFQQILNYIENKFQQILNYIEERFELMYDSLYEALYNDKISPLERRMRSLELQVETFLQSVAGGTALTDQFGGSEYIGVNQKVLTDAINKIWDRLGEISGEDYLGISLVVSPEYFISEDGCSIHIIATTEKTNGIFEKLQLYLNGELLTEVENIDYFEYDVNINETSVLMCKAKILGVEYTKMKTITHYNSFWLGAGSNYEEIMNVQHVIPITNGMKGNYDVSFNQGDHLFVIVGNSLREGFHRADMNGMEIPFTEEEINIDGNVYKVFTSNNTYRQGNYNIDINS